MGQIVSTRPLIAGGKSDKGSLLHVALNLKGPPLSSAAGARNIRGCDARIRDVNLVHTCHSPNIASHWEIAYMYVHQYSGLKTEIVGLFPHPCLLTLCLSSRTFPIAYIRRYQDVLWFWGQSRTLYHDLNAC
jgi:hypothetical protein